MSSTVTLNNNGPLRYFTQNIIFERGVSVQVPREVAAEILRSRRKDWFSIHIGAGTEPDKKGPPSDPELRIQAIREVIDNLDEDNESVWMSNGKPDARALSSILGWQVTSVDRDLAMSSGATKRRGIVKKKLTAPIKDAMDTGDDPTMAEAVEV